MKTFIEERLKYYASIYKNAGMELPDYLQEKRPVKEPFKSELVDGTLKLEVNGPIDEFFGVDLRDLTAELDDNPDAPVELRVTSPGGDYFAALAFYGRLRERDAPVTTIASGIAASAGSILLLAGDERTVNEGTMVMAHAVQGGLLAFGGRKEIKNAAKEIDAVLEKLDNNLVEIYQNRLGISQEEATQLIDGDNWFTSSEAIEKGFATETKEQEEKATNEVVLTDDEPVID